MGLLFFNHKVRWPQIQVTNAHPRHPDPHALRAIQERPQDTTVMASLQTATFFIRHCLGLARSVRVCRECRTLLANLGVITITTENIIPIIKTTSHDTRRLCWVGREKLIKCQRDTLTLTLRLANLANTKWCKRPRLFPSKTWELKKKMMLHFILLTLMLRSG